MDLFVNKMNKLTVLVAIGVSCCVLPSTGRHHPSHHSEVVRAELDKPLGHVWMLDIVPPHPLKIRERQTVKEAITREERLVLHFCTVTLTCIRLKRAESSCTQTNTQSSGCTALWLVSLLILTCWGLVWISVKWWPVPSSFPLYRTLFIWAAVVKLSCCDSSYRRLTVSHNQYLSAWWRLAAPFWGHMLEPVILLIRVDCAQMSSRCHLPSPKKILQSYFKGQCWWYYIV